MTSVERDISTINDELLHQWRCQRPTNSELMDTSLPSTSIRLNHEQKLKRRQIPLIAQWTELLHINFIRSTSGAELTAITLDIENQLILLARRLPRTFLLQRYLLGGRISTSDQLFNTSYIPSPMNNIIKLINYLTVCGQYRLSMTLLHRMDAPRFNDGPLAALQRRKRLPDASLITLIVLENSSEHYLLSSHWSNNPSRLPQRAIIPSTLHDVTVDSIDTGGRQYIGIIHYLVHRPRKRSNNLTPVTFDPSSNGYDRLLMVLTRHSNYINTPMMFDLNQQTFQRSSQKYTPWQIAALKGDKLMLLLITTIGAIPQPNFMHPNELQLRQLIYERWLSSEPVSLPYNGINDFDVDYLADVPQGAHSEVRKAVRNNDPSYDKRTYAMKMITLKTLTTHADSTNTTPLTVSLGPIVNEIVAGIKHGHNLRGLTSTDTHVMFFTDFIRDGQTLERYFTVLYQQKESIMMDSSDEMKSLTGDERGMMYICSQLWLIDSIIDTMSEVHCDKLLHRDLRPSNIMLGTKSWYGNEEPDRIRPPFEATLIDYGHSTVNSNGNIHSSELKVDDPYFYCVTAPEVRSGQSYTLGLFSAPHLCLLVLI
jgi:hypothetical protein